MALYRESHFCSNSAIGRTTSLKLPRFLSQPQVQNLHLRRITRSSASLYQSHHQKLL
ncbi:hypothetical protein BC830DRAFT_1117696 [Chytriomyces sp. MP71]|nr:hypothetical protein BC830DRAFT_1117696 [Chytriomyces sp. MP71]